MTPQLIEYLPDAGVDPATDRQIRDLLLTCFTAAEDAVFHHRRYFIEPYPHRWVIRGPAGNPVAHVGVHDKAIETGGRSYRFGGIAEVCVHPDERGRGHVRSMLATLHPWLEARGFTFALLFGDPAVYGSSGYRVVTNILMDDDPANPAGRRHSVSAMARPVAAVPWPDEPVYLSGPRF